MRRCHTDIFVNVVINILTTNELKNNINIILDVISEKGSVDAIKYFVLHGFVTDDVKKWGARAATHAAECGHLNVVKYIINLGLSINDIRQARGFMLHSAIRSNNFEIVKFIMDQGMVSDDITRNIYSKLGYEILTTALETALENNISYNKNQVFKYIISKLQTR